MTLHDAIEDAARTAGSAPVRHPGEWPAAVTLDGEGGWATSVPTEKASADERMLLEGWLLDPDEWRIVPGTLLVNRWHTTVDGVPTWLHQYKARVERSTVRTYTADALFKRLPKVRSKALPPNNGEQTHTFVVNLADWQIGKAMERGGGTPETIARIRTSDAGAHARYKALRKTGIAFKSVAVVGLGDLAERCSNNYASQAFTTDLDEREQERVVVRLLRDIICGWAKVTPDLVVACVGGNHGENRGPGGKAFTTPGDNRDVSVFERVAEMLAMDPASYGHVRWHIPGNELTICLELSGVRCAWTHGHLAKGGVPAVALPKWWAGQSFGRVPVDGAGSVSIADADVLTTGHFHHEIVMDLGGRYWVQVPAQDGGSGWYERQTGAHSKTGCLTYVVGPGILTNVEVV